MNFMFNKTDIHTAQMTSKTQKKEQAVSTDHKITCRNKAKWELKCAVMRNDYLPPP